MHLARAHLEVEPVERARPNRFSSPRTEMALVMGATIPDRRTTESCIPVANVASLTVEGGTFAHYIHLATLDRGRINIAAGLGHSERSLTWIIDWVRKRLDR